MRILLSHFLDDQYERVSKVLEDDPKAPMSTLFGLRDTSDSDSPVQQVRFLGWSEGTVSRAFEASHLFLSYSS